VDNQMYIWGWGRIDRGKGRGRGCPTPCLLDSVKAKAGVRRLQVSSSAIIALSQDGELYRWNSSPSDVKTDAKGHSKPALQQAMASHGRKAAFRETICKGPFVECACTLKSIYAINNDGTCKEFVFREKDWKAVLPKSKIESNKAEIEDVAEATTKSDAKVEEKERPEDVEAREQVPTKRSSKSVDRSSSTASGSQNKTLLEKGLIETSEQKMARVVATSTLFVAMSTTGKVFTSGASVLGALGHGDTITILKNPLHVKCLDNFIITRIAVGFEHVAVVTDHGDVWCWGWGARGQLGNGLCKDVYEPIKSKLPKGMMVIDISCGFEHTAAVGARGKVMTWGGGSRGQLGIGWKPAIATEPQILDGAKAGALHDQHVIMVSCGAFHTAAITALGEVAVWGWGEYGQLGLGHRSTVSLPKIVEAISGMDASVLCCGGSTTVVATDRFMVLQQDYFSEKVDNKTPLGEAENDESFNSAAVPVIFFERTPSRTPSSKTEKAEPITSSNQPPISRRSSTSSDVKSTMVLPRPTSTNRSWKSSKKTTARTKSPLEASVGTYRPHNLPPKSAREVAKHKREVAKTEAMFRKKLAKAKEMEVQKAKKIQKKKENMLKKERRQRAEEERRETTFQHQVNLWQNEIIANWNNNQIGFLMTKQKAARAKARSLAIKQGVPSLIRRKVWPLWCGNSLGITPAIWEDLKKMTKKGNERKAYFARPSDSKDRRSTHEKQEIKSPEASKRNMSHLLIATDITRTFPRYCFFQKECPMHDQLKQILESYCFFQPQLGYVQGMSYLAGHLLFHLEEYPAFVVFSNLLASSFMQAFLKLDNSKKMLDRYHLYEMLLRENEPELHRHLQNEGISVDMYFLEWALTLFCKRLEPEVLGRVWDQWFVLGEITVYKAAVAIMLTLKRKLIGQPFGRILKALATLPQKIGTNELCNMMLKVKTSAIFRRKLDDVVEADDVKNRDQATNKKLSLMNMFMKL